MASPFHEPVIHLGNNLEFFEHHPEHHNTCDLIYLDPPYNSNRAYNVIMPGKAFDEAYSDTWTWDAEAMQQVRKLQTYHSQDVAQLAEFVAHYLSRTDSRLAAYIIHCLARLVHMHAYLKETGSLVLHCDLTAVHWLRVAVEAVFGPDSVYSVAHWSGRAPGHNKATKSCPPDTDYLIFAAKTDKYTWNPLKTPYSKEYLKSARYDNGAYWKPQPLTGPGKREGESGQPWRGIMPFAEGNKPRHWAINREVVRQYKVLTGKDLVATDEQMETGPMHARMDAAFEAGVIQIDDKGRPFYRGYLDVDGGTQLQQTWLDISYVSSASNESVNFETQKPEALLERVIRLTCNEGDLVLDPYLGSGTTAIAAYRLKRRFMGIEISSGSVELAKRRLAEVHGVGSLGTQHTIIRPVDVASARALAAQNKIAFQDWVMSCLGGISHGVDKNGVDGTVRIVGVPGKQDRSYNVIVQVKGGGYKTSDVSGFCDLRTRLNSVLDASAPSGHREDDEKGRAIMGLFVAFESEFTQGDRRILKENGQVAVTAGGHVAYFNRMLPVSIEQLVERSFNVNALLPGIVVRPDLTESVKYQERQVEAALAHAMNNMEQDEEDSSAELERTRARLLARAAAASAKAATDAELKKAQKKSKKKGSPTNGDPLAVQTKEP